MADSMITESAQSDTAELLSENLRAATPLDSMNDKEQQPLESSEKSSKPKDINSADKSELMESRYATPKKSRSYRKTNVRKNLESDDEGMEQHKKGSSKKGKSPNDGKTRTDGSNESPKKRSMEDPNVTPRKRPRSGSKESSEEKSGGHSKDRSRRRSRSRDRSREDSSDTPRKRHRNRSKESSKEKSEENSKNRSRRKSRSRDRSREDSSDTPSKHKRNRSKESSKERSGKHSDEKSGTHSRERRERSRDKHRSESKSPGKKKVIESHGNNSSESTAVKKTSQTQKNKNNITKFFKRVTPQKKDDEKETRISPILFDEPNDAEYSDSLRKEDSLKLLKQDYKLDKRENFHFFFGKDDPFSNFHPARFTVNGETYTCSEQFMMHQKAMLFQDWFHAAEIMKAKVPLQMKRLGRKVQNFDPHVWGAECDKIMKRGLKAKFTENEHLKMKLITTFPRILVEASPRDRLWGIGLGGKNEKAHCRLTWRGKNKLGYLLTYIRNEIMEEEGLFH